MSSVHLRKYASKMFPSVRLEGFGQQRTAIQLNFKGKCEGLDRIWVWMGDVMMWNKAWAGRETMERLQLWCNARSIALKRGLKTNDFKRF